MEESKGMQKYAVMQLVGEGSFGKVYKGRRRGTCETVALKVITKAGKSEKDIRSLRQEIDILSQLSHPNIVQMLELTETSAELFVVTEFAQGMCFSSMLLLPLFLPVLMCVCVYLSTSVSDSQTDRLNDHVHLLFCYQASCLR